MRINNIFAIVKGSLYSARFQKEEQNEFSRIFALWNDAEFLEDFFESHRQDLHSFWQHVTVEEAVMATMEEANILERKLVRIAEKGFTDREETLSGLFSPLRNGFTRVEPLEKNKVRGHRRHSWLRLYAVRLDVNVFVISGGAIKLTRTMNERTHLVMELKKLDMLCAYFRESGTNEFEMFEMY